MRKLKSDLRQIIDHHLPGSLLEPWHGELDLLDFLFGFDQLHVVELEISGFVQGRHLPVPWWASRGSGAKLNLCRWSCSGTWQISTWSIFQLCTFEIGWSSPAWPRSRNRCRHLSHTPSEPFWQRPQTFSELIRYAWPQYPGHFPR